MSIALTAAILRGHPLPTVDDNADKNARGRAVIIAGSREVPGAPVLCGVAAFRAGAGKVQLAVPSPLSAALGIGFPECGIVDVRNTRKLNHALGGADAVLIGPGLTGDASRVAAKSLSRSKGAFVFDAAALPGLLGAAASIAASRRRLVITPHGGEMAAMLNVDKAVVDRDGLIAARKAAAAFKCVVVLKGPCTFIVDTAGRAWHFTAGGPGLATAGSGDVLAGILTGLLARGADPITASLWAVWTHARAGHVLSRRVGAIGFLGRELLEEVPRLLDRGKRR